jgi:hypothetical protein
MGGRGGLPWSVEGCVSEVLDQGARAIRHNLGFDIKNEGLIVCPCVGYGSVGTNQVLQ